MVSDEEFEMIHSMVSREVLKAHESNAKSVVIGEDDEIGEMIFSHTVQEIDAIVRRFNLEVGYFIDRVWNGGEWLIFHL